MMTRNELWQKRQQAIRVARTQLNNITRKEKLSEKATPKQMDTPVEKRNAVLANFAITPSFPERDEGNRSAEPDPLEMEAIRQEAVNYTRPFGGNKGREL